MASVFRVFLGPYISVFRLITKIYKVNLCIQKETGKYGPGKTLHLDTFHGVVLTLSILLSSLMGLVIKLCKIPKNIIHTMADRQYA